MSSGVLLSYGQTWILDSIKSTIVTNSGLYIGLLNNTNGITYTSQLPVASGISEVSGVGYDRHLVSTWTVYSGIDPYIQGGTITFNASGTWTSVNGYFISVTSSGNDALWAESFPVGGTVHSGEAVIVTPTYYQTYGY